MKKAILFFALILSMNSFAVVHTYYFKLQGVTTAADAKGKIDEMRAILGINMCFFDDNTDTFKTETEWEYNWDDMSEDLALHGIYIDGIIEHFISG